MRFRYGSNDPVAFCSNAGESYGNLIFLIVTVGIGVQQASYQLFSCSLFVLSSGLGGFVFQ